MLDSKQPLDVALTTGSRTIEGIKLLVRATPLHCPDRYRRGGARPSGNGRMPRDVILIASWQNLWRFIVNQEASQMSIRKFQILFKSQPQICAVGASEEHSNPRENRLC
jgi:hypothetical protein